MRCCQSICTPVPTHAPLPPGCPKTVMKGIASVGAGRHTGSTRCRTATISRPTRTRPPPAAAFPQQLELIQPHAQKAFDLLVNYVERDIELPPDQCIPRGGEIAAAPTQPGHCAQL